MSAQLTRPEQASTSRLITRGGLFAPTTPLGLGTLNYRSRTYVLEQADVEARFAWLTPELFESALTEYEEAMTAVQTGRPTLLDPGAVAQLPTHTRAEFRAITIKCVRETPGIFGSRRGVDEIDLAGTAIIDGGEPTEIEQFTVGDFDSGDWVTFSPARTLATFPLSSASYPATMAVMVSLAEIDEGGFGEFLQRLLEAAGVEAEEIFEKLRDKLAIAGGAAVGAWVGGPLGALVGAVVTWAIIELIDWIAGTWQDDVFTPQLAAITLPRPTARFAGGSPVTQTQVFRWEEHDAIYRMSYDWLLHFAPGPVVQGVG